MTLDDNFITVMTFMQPHDLAVVRVLLESEGIECFVKDELTAQVNWFYSNAIGGVKLQVKQSDLDKAIEILKSGGYLTDADLQDDNLKLYIKLDNATSKIPFVKKLRVEHRLITIVAISVLLILVVVGLWFVYFVPKPTITERLTQNYWCADYINYRGKDFQLITNEKNTLVIVTDSKDCSEGLEFERNGILIIPGFNTPSIKCNWTLKNDSLLIANVDTFGYVYNGLYNINFLREDLILKSAKTTIYCHLQEY